MKVRLNNLPVDNRLAAIRAVRFVSGGLGLEESEDLVEAEMQRRGLPLNGGKGQYSIEMDCGYPTMTVLHDQCSAAVRAGNLLPLGTDGVIVEEIEAPKHGRKPGADKLRITELEKTAAWLKLENDKLTAKINDVTKERNLLMDAMWESESYRRLNATQAETIRQLNGEISKMSNETADVIGQRDRLELVNDELTGDNLLLKDEKQALEEQLNTTVSIEVGCKRVTIAPSN